MMAFPLFGNRAATNPPAAERRRRTRERRGGQEAPGPEDPQAARDRRHRWMAWGIGTIMVLVLVGVLGAGYYDKFFHPPRVWAGRVNGVEFSMGDLVTRMRMLQGLTGQVDLATQPFEFLQDMLNAEVLRQEAPNLGIGLTDEQIGLALKSPSIGFYPAVPAGQETDPGQLDREFEETYGIFLTRTGLSDNEYRTILGEQLRELRLGFLLGQEIDDIQEQVEVQWIRLESQGDVDPRTVRERLEFESFETVANEVGVPREFANPSGYVGWVPRNAFPDLDFLLFGDEEEGFPALGVEEISDPTFSSDSMFIVRIRSGPEPRELSDRMRGQMTNELVKQWHIDNLNRGSREGWLQMNFNSRLYSWVADQVLLSKRRGQSEER